MQCHHALSLLPPLETPSPPPSHSCAAPIDIQAGSRGSFGNNRNRLALRSNLPSNGRGEAGQVSARRLVTTSPFGDTRIDLGQGEGGMMATVDGGANGSSQHSQASGMRNEMLALPSLAGFGMGGSVSGCIEECVDESKLVFC